MQSIFFLFPSFGFPSRHWFTLQCGTVRLYSSRVSGSIRWLSCQEFCAEKRNGLSSPVNLICFGSWICSNISSAWNVKIRKKRMYIAFSFSEECLLLQHSRVDVVEEELLISFLGIVYHVLTRSHSLWMITKWIQVAMYKTHYRCTISVEKKAH